MSDVIVIGTDGETGPFEAIGLSCFEPGPGCMAERVLAERVRCEVLAMTPAAFQALPARLGCSLRESVWPELVIVPPVRDVRAAARVVDDLRRILADRRSLHAA